MKFILSIFLFVIAALLIVWWKAGFPLPLMCTTRGCVTNIELRQEREYQTAFAQTVGSEAPSEKELLTTIVRRHLIYTTKPSISLQDEAQRYRTDVLHFTNEEELHRIHFSSFEEYDNAVTIPFLLQQAYINEHKLKDANDVYIDLSKHLRVFSLRFHTKWDTSKGQVVAN